MTIPSSTAAQWSFYNPVNLILGRGCRAGFLPSVNGQRILVVTTKRGRQQLLDDDVLCTLVDQCSVHWVDSITENPALEDLQESINQHRNLAIDAVIGFGGGSSLDAAKALNLALHPDCYMHTLAELISNPRLHPEKTRTSLYVLPTTAGTGSEVTPFATIWNRTEGKKMSLASNAIFPKVAYVDASLTDSLPLAATLSTGLDAINQAMESVWNINANPITLAFATRSLKLSLSSLPELINGNNTKKLRDEMAEASALAGLAISHTRTALCHSISYPLTIHFGIPHGLACAFTMPAVFEHNLAGDDGRFIDLANQLFGSKNVNMLTDCLQILHKKMRVEMMVKSKIPCFSDLLSLQHEMIAPGRADNNLVPIDNLEHILRKAWAE